MPVIKGLIQADGPIVSVALGWSALNVRTLRAALRPIPPPVDAHALLDSGAEVTCIDHSLVHTLGFPLGGFTLANVPASGGLTLGIQHDVSLTIVHPSGNALLNLVLPDVPVLELSLAPLGYQVLIGRDVLNRCRFHGPRGRLRLAYA
jgi:hypothetical protein